MNITPILIQIFTFLFWTISVETKRPPPNFIIFFIDDLITTSNWIESAPELDGITSSSVVSQYIDIPTPNIDQLIRNQGIQIPRSYTSAPTCSPSRFGILTGRQTARSKYAQYRSNKTGDITQGTNVIVNNARLWDEDLKYNIPYQLTKSNSETSNYLTGMIGKWHLMSTFDEDSNPAQKHFCAALDSNEADSEEATINRSELYDTCTQILKDNDLFDFVDAYFNGNIHSNAPYGHNPEWMVQQTKRFFDLALENTPRPKPFFLYWASTLTHDPEVNKSLNPNRIYDIHETPKGILEGDDIPNDTGMKSRDEIWDQANDWCSDIANDLLDPSGECKKINQIAATMWLDDSIGAVLNYLKVKSEGTNYYDNTFIVFMNDHGQPAKGSLYEHGIRVIQFIKYLDLYNPGAVGGINHPNGFVVSNDIITSNIDLAQVIFDLSQTDIPSEYVFDGYNWYDDIQNEILGINPSDNSGNFEWKFIDNMHSHAIIEKQYKYIYRANVECELEEECDDVDHCNCLCKQDLKKEGACTLGNYPYFQAEEQVYMLYDENGNAYDINEQDNIINGIDADKLAIFRRRMRNYIQEKSCWNDETECNQPCNPGFDIECN